MNYAYLDLWGSRVFYSSVGLTSMPWLRRCFLVGEKLFISCILQNPFLVGVFLIRVKCGAQDISLYTYVCEPCKRHVGPVSFIPSTYPSMKRHFGHPMHWWPSVAPVIPNMDRQPFGVSHKNLSKVISYFKIVSYYKLVSYYLGSRNYTYQLLLMCLCLRTKLLDTMFDSRGVNAKRKLEVMDATKISWFF